MSLVLATGPGLIEGLVNEENKFTILPQTGSTTFDPSKCSVAFEGPSKPDIRFVNNRDHTVDCFWTAKLPGSYKIFVRYEDQETAYSPYTCKISGGEEIAQGQVSRIQCIGTALEHGYSNAVNEVMVDTRDSNIVGGINVSMEGPSKPELTFKNSEPGILVLQYIPPSPGNYKLNLKFGEIHLGRSPYTIKVT